MVAAKSGKDGMKQPTINSYLIMKKSLEDPLLEARLAFFVAIAKPIEEILTIYQTDKPMIPFLYAALEGLYGEILERFVKWSVLDKNLSGQRRLRLDLDSDENLVAVRSVHIGYVNVLKIFHPQYLFSLTFEVVLRQQYTNNDRGNKLPSC